MFDTLTAPPPPTPLDKWLTLSTVGWQVAGEEKSRSDGWILVLLELIKRNQEQFFPSARSFSIFMFLLHKGKTEERKEDWQLFSLSHSSVFLVLDKSTTGVCLFGERFDGCRVARHCWIIHEGFPPLRDVCVCVQQCADYLLLKNKIRLSLWMKRVPSWTLNRNGIRHPAIL